LSAGVKFADADLRGVPLQMVVSERGLKEDKVEIKRRDSGERVSIGVDDAVGMIRELIGEMFKALN